MTKTGILWVMGGLSAILWQAPAFADESVNAGSEFKEIYDLIREHAGGISQDELDRASVKGLLWALKPRVSLVTNVAATNASSPVVTKSNLFDGEIAYVRIGHVGAGLPDAVRSACD